MRERFLGPAEKGRIADGPYGTRRGRSDGAFVIQRGESHLTCLVSSGSQRDDPIDVPWEHVSVSLPNRCPTWDEMCFVKDLFFRPEEVVMQLHPAAAEYVNVHPYCLHLWRPLRATIPLPPLVAV